MGEKKSQKFSLGDIIRKLNEAKKNDEKNETVDSDRKDAAISHSASEERQAPGIFLSDEKALSPSLPSDAIAPPVSVSGAASNAPVPKETYPQTSIASVSFQDTRHEARTGNIAPSVVSSDQNDETSDFDILRYIGILIRRKNILFAAIIIASIFSIYNYVKAVRFYTAHARMLFSPGYQDIMGNNQNYYAGWDSREEKINTHLELLKSQTILKSVSENLNNGLTLGDITGGVSVNRGMVEGEKNNIIDVSFYHPSAQTARDVANEICRTYIEYIKAVSVQDLAVLIAKLEDQIAKKESDLDQKETALRLFKENNRAVQLTSEANMTIAKLTQLETAMQQTQLDMLACREKLLGLKKEISQQQVDVIQSSTYLNPYQSRLAELEIELNTLSAEYSPEHFKVRIVKGEIDKIKDAMKSDLVKEASSKTFVKNPIRETLLQDLVTVTIDKSVLDAKRIAQEQIAKDLDGELKKLPSVELQFAQLTRETESLLQVLKLLKTNYEEAKIKRDSQESDLKILEWAQTPLLSVSNVGFSRIFIILFMGLFIGIICALLIEYLDQSIKEPQEIEHMLELPLLGIVPMIETEKAIIESSKDHGKTILEPFRALRANVKHIAETRRIKMFIVASAVKGEGKTTLAANIAITFALDGKKVILVDGDLRRAQIHSLFHLPKKNGLCDYLLGAAEIQDILKSTVHQNLFVITAGEHPQNPAELVGSFRFSELVKNLRGMADIILFDSPALLPVSDVLSMAPKMDACIMVFRALWTPLKAAKQAKSQLQRIGCTIVGGLLNGISLSRGYYPYYYGYYRYYAYKYSYDDVKEPKFSLRKAGLAAESRFKNIFLAIGLSVPGWSASIKSFLRDVSRKKIFRILLLAAILLSLADAFVEYFNSMIKHKKSITFIGPIDQSDKKTKPIARPDNLRAEEHSPSADSISEKAATRREDDGLAKPADSADNGIKRITIKGDSLDQ